MSKIGKLIRAVITVTVFSLMLARGAYSAPPTKIYCPDVDGDRYGDPIGCTDVKTTGYATNGDDCDDILASVNPGTNEINGNTIDENCDGVYGAYFPDPNLEACVLSITGGDYSDIALNAMTQLWCEDANIANISGMEYLPNLSSAYLRMNPISDLSPMAGLTNLGILDLSYTQVSDVSQLSSLPNLHTLELSWCPLLDLNTLGDIPNLNWLNLTANNFSSLSGIGFFGNLITLSLHNSTIADNDMSPLATSAPNLENLVLSKTGFSNFSTLGSLVNLKTLSVDYNNITSLNGFPALLNMISISMQYNCIDDLTPFSLLPNLYTLHLTHNSITDFSPVAHVLDISGTDFQGFCIIM